MPGTILSAWSFAVEHWQQSVLQKTSATPIYNMSNADPEAMRVAVGQARSPPARAFSRLLS